MRTYVILITGHPATGKTNLANCLSETFSYPLISKDQIKESLLESLGTGTTEWSRQLSAAAWGILYQHMHNLLRANVSFIVESNFDPYYADARWQRLKRLYDFHLAQIRCTTEPEALLQRYCQRIDLGERHQGHVDSRHDPAFLKAIQQPMAWVDVDGDRLSFDTTNIGQVNYGQVTNWVRDIIGT